MAELSPLAQLGLYGRREDGSMKGDGWVGTVPARDGGLATEYSATGDGMLYPLIYKGITPTDLMYVMREVNTKGATRMPNQVVDRAYKAAMTLRQQGLSPFAD
jgi:hypothetical protein